MKTTAIDLIANGASWVITSEMMNTITAVAERTNDINALKAQIDKPLQNTRKVTRRGDVAIIPISGSIFPKANLFTEISAATSVDVLAADLNTALNDKSIRRIVLNIDSPGGNVTGINEFSKIINNANKPIISYVSGMAASAAYWIASASDEIVCDETAQLGNIGVVSSVKLNTDSDYIEIVSSRAQDKRPNIRTSEGETVFQKIIDDIEDVFLETVSKNIGLTVKQIASHRGRILIGKHAVKAGFADSLGSFESIINKNIGKTAVSYSSSQVDTQKKETKIKTKKYNHRDAIANYAKGLSMDSQKSRQPVGFTNDAIQNYSNSL